MAPLMTINGDDVIDASLLEPGEEKSGPSPTSWVREIGSQEPQALLPYKQKSPDS